MPSSPRPHKRFHRVLNFFFGLRLFFEPHSIGRVGRRDFYKTIEIRSIYSGYVPANASQSISRCTISLSLSLCLLLRCHSLSERPFGTTRLSPKTDKKQTPLSLSPRSRLVCLPMFAHIIYYPEPETTLHFIT